MRSTDNADKHPLVTLLAMAGVAGIGSLDPFRSAPRELSYTAQDDRPPQRHFARKPGRPRRKARKAWR